ncbi:MAG: acyl-CoA dehydrogenase [Burkholderiales bacterium]|nr:acyl-CoA dehydrogenase [Burkholderiales bacterium]
MRDAQSVLVACGRYAVPVPLGEVMLARAFASAAHATLPDGVGTAAPGRVEDDRIVATAVPWGRSVDWVMAVTPAKAYVFEAGSAESSAHAGLIGAAECDMRWRLSEATLTFAPAEGTDWRLAGAALRTAQIAGALEAVLELTIGYASERKQFSRTLAKFQAIQQQIAVLAEDALAARMAASIACESEIALPRGTRTGAAKAVASEAAARACAISHAVHGAMGITEAYDLQLFTGRLLSWRMQYGSESYWNERVGAELVRANGRATWDFVRAST